MLIRLRCGVADHAARAEVLCAAQANADGLTQSLQVLSLMTSAWSSPATGANKNPNNNAPTLIDIDRDGYLEKTAWIAANRSVLAIDANNDGQITPDELLHWGGAPSAVADSTNLRWLDANRDQRLDSSDAGFGALRIWSDRNVSTLFLNPQVP